MRKLILILIITLMTSVSAHSSCLNEKGKYIMTLIGLKTRAYIKSKNMEKIRAKYDLIEAKMHQDCKNAGDCDGSYISQGIQKQKENELDKQLEKALSDNSWCNDGELIRNMKNLRDQKVKFCKQEDAGDSLAEIGLDSANYSGQNSCLSDGSLEAWEGVSPRTINLPIKQLCETVLRKMKTIVQKCESKSVAKKSSSSGCEIADADGNCPGSSANNYNNSQGPQNGAGRIIIQNVKYEDVDLGKRKRATSNSGGRGSNQ